MIKLLHFFSNTVPEKANLRTKETDTWKVEQSNIETAIKTVLKEPDQQVKDESSDISSYASLEVVQLLFKAGLKANEKNNQGKTPLDLAKRKRDENSDQDLKSRYDAIVKYLEQAIASPSE